MQTKRQNYTQLWNTAKQIFAYSVMISIISNTVLTDIHTLSPNMWFLQDSYNPLNSVHCNTLLKTAQTCQSQAVNVLIQSQYSSEIVRLNQFLHSLMFSACILKCAIIENNKVNWHLVLIRPWAAPCRCYIRGKHR